MKKEICVRHQSSRVYARFNRPELGIKYDTQQARMHFYKMAIPCKRNEEMFKENSRTRLGLFVNILQVIYLHFFFVKKVFFHHSSQKPFFTLKKRNIFFSQKEM